MTRHRFALVALLVGVVGVWQCGAFLLGASASCSGSRSGSGGRVSCTKHLFKVNPQVSQLETHALSPGSPWGLREHVPPTPTATQAPCLCRGPHEPSDS
jgi:hypothetical protein